NGPPGIIFNTAKPMIDTITSRMMLCHKRLIRNPAIQPSRRITEKKGPIPCRLLPSLMGSAQPGLAPGTGQALHAEAPNISSSLAGPARRMPRLGTRIAVVDRALDIRFPAPDDVLGKERQKGQIGAHQRLNFLVDFNATLLIKGTSALFQQFVDFRIAVLRGIRSTPALGSDRASMKPVKYIWIGADQIIDPHHNRVILRQRPEITPDHGRRQVGDLHFDADLLHGLLDELL